MQNGLSIISKRRFIFTGKERDEETGYSYFGARYYNSGLPNIFLSVDPMSDKYPSISPYAYCAWNPVRLVDPDGREIDDYFSREGRYLGSDQASSSNVRVMDESEWNKKSDGNGHIDHDIGYMNSYSHSESGIGDDASLNIYKYYWGNMDNKHSNVKLLKESRAGKMGKHKMDARTEYKISNGNKSVVKRLLYIDFDVMNKQGYSDNYNDIISCFEHEDRHFFQHTNSTTITPGEEEYDALRHQINSQTFRKCSSSFQKEINIQLNKHTPSYITIVR